MREMVKPWVLTSSRERVFKIRVGPSEKIDDGRLRCPRRTRTVTNFLESSDLLRASEDTTAIDIPYCALGTIKYLNDGDGCTTGKILYIKPVVRRRRARSRYHRVPSRPPRFSSPIDCRTRVRRGPARTLPRAWLSDDKANCRSCEEQRVDSDTKEVLRVSRKTRPHHYERARKSLSLLAAR
jgi:hypothetical protein